MRPADQGRYARQILLAGVGIAGQARVLSGTAAVTGEGLAHEVATLYATRAGFGELAAGEIALDAAAVVRHPAAAGVLAGSRAALAAFRRTAVTEAR
ncbi:MAG: hypothetical protein RIF41_37365 [Polyangiaceae bacterium]